MIKKLGILSMFLLILIIGLSVYIILKKPEVLYVFDREKQLRDSLQILAVRLDSSEKRVTLLQVKYDSITSIEQQVIRIDREKIKFIYTTATPAQLDSIIRSAWTFRHY